MKRTKLLVLTLFVLATGIARAELQVVAPEAPGFPGLVRDSGQGLLWLKDTNWAWNSGTLERPISWNEAWSWADDLVVIHDGRTYDNWRLPKVAEMAYLRANYSSAGYPIGTGFTTLPDVSDKVTDPGPFLVGRFIELMAADAWALDEVTDPSMDKARYMDMDAAFTPDGYVSFKSATQMLTWGAVMVPEPETYAMLLIGLALVGLHLVRSRDKRIG
jgi:hypothetical protein